MILDDDECPDCRATGKKIAKAALRSLEKTLTATVTPQEKEHMPASIVLLHYLGTVLKTLATSVAIEVQKTIESGVPVEEAEEVLNHTVEGVMDAVSEAFNIQIKSRAVAPENIAALDAALNAYDATAAGKPSADEVH